MQHFWMNMQVLQLVQELVCDVPRRAKTGARNGILWYSLFLNNVLLFVSSTVMGLSKAQKKLVKVSFHTYSKTRFPKGAYCPKILFQF